MITFVRAAAFAAVAFSFYASKVWWLTRSTPETPTFEFACRFNGIFEAKLETHRWSGILESDIQSAPTTVKGTLPALRQITAGSRPEFPRIRYIEVDNTSSEKTDRHSSACSPESEENNGRMFELTSSR